MPKIVLDNSDEPYRKLLQIDPDDPDTSKKFQKMEDIEIVLRFFALYKTNGDTLAKGFKTFLDNELNELNKLKAAQIEKHKKVFYKMIDCAGKALGDEAFAKYKMQGKKLIRTSRFNAAVFDSFSVAIAKKLENAKDLPTEASEKLLSLFYTKAYFDSVTGSVNDKAKVVYRLGAAQKALNV